MIWCDFNSIENDEDGPYIYGIGHGLEFYQQVMVYDSEGNYVTGTVVPDVPTDLRDITRADHPSRQWHKIRLDMTTWQGAD